LNGNGKVDAMAGPANEILHEGHYYPFGLEMTGPWSESDNPDVFDNRFNGKERMQRYGLNYHDFGARCEAFPFSATIKSIVFNYKLIIVDLLEFGKLQLTSDQKKQYLGLVQNFAKYWKEYNKQYEEGNVYDDTPTHEGPDAALDVFNKSNK